MRAWTQLVEPGPALAMLCIALAFTTQAYGAPTLPETYAEQSTEIEYYPVADATGCYYNFQHYDEGDRIITNEPCLNCTCHNRMLMCYLRVCPFTKAIGANCKVEKRPDQCCPTITCPEVPVHLVTSTVPSTALGHLNEYGCSIDGLFYSDGARVPSNPENPCELCYCIRNKTACVMQECTLNVDGCRPVFQEGVCCPVRYNCEHPNYLEGPTTPQITTTSTTTTTTEAPTTTLQPFECIFHGHRYNDGELVKNDIPCEKCYCMHGDIVCAVQECGPTPLDKVNCTALPVREGQCCPDTYDCAGVLEEELTTLSSVSYETEPTTQGSVFEEKGQEFTQQPLTTAHVAQEEEYKPTTGTETSEIPEAITKATLPEESEKEKHPVEGQVHKAETSTPEVLEEITSQPEDLKPVEGDSHVPEIESSTPQAVEEITKQPEEQQPVEPEGHVAETETKIPESVEEITKQPEEQQPVEAETVEPVTRGPEDQQPVETEGPVTENETKTPESVEEITKQPEEQQPVEAETVEPVTRGPEDQQPVETEGPVTENETKTAESVEEITKQPEGQVPQTETKTSESVEAVTRGPEEQQPGQVPESEGQVPESETKTPEIVEEITRPVEAEAHIPEVELSTPEVVEGITKEPEIQKPVEVDSRVPEIEASTPVVVEEITQQPAEAPQPAEHVTEKSAEEITTHSQAGIAGADRETTEGVQETQRPEVEQVTKVGTESEVAEKEPVTIVTPISPEATTETAGKGSNETPSQEEEIPKTTESPIESITSRVTEAIESITSRVTEVVESITTAFSGSSSEEPAEEITEHDTEQQTEVPKENDEVTETPIEQPESDKTGVTPVMPDKEQHEVTYDKEGPIPTGSEVPKEESPVTTERAAEGHITKETGPGEEVQTTEADKTFEEPAVHRDDIEGEEEDQETEVPTTDIEKPSDEQVQVTSTVRETGSVEVTTVSKPENEITSSSAQPEGTSSPEITVEASSKSPEKEEETSESDQTKPTESEADIEPVLKPDDCGDKGCANIPEAKPTDSEEIQPAVTESIIKSEKCNDKECARVPIETQPSGEGSTELPGETEQTIAGEQTTAASETTEKEDAQTEKVLGEQLEEQQPTKPASESPEVEGQVTELPEHVPEQQHSEPTEKEGVQTEKSSGESVEEQQPTQPEAGGQVTEIPEHVPEQQHSESPQRIPEEPVTKQQPQEPSESSTKQPIEKQRPETERPVEESESERPEEPQTTEEEVIIITEIPAKKTELPESMDHVSETVQPTETPKERLHTTPETATEKEVTETNKQEISSEEPEVSKEPDAHIPEHSEGKPESTELPTESEVESQKTTAPVLHEEEGHETATEESEPTEATILEITESAEQEETVAIHDTPEEAEHPKEEENEIEHDAVPHKEEENEIEHDESETTITKTEEHVTEGKIYEAETEISAVQPTAESAKPEEDTKEGGAIDAVKPEQSTKEGETPESVLPEGITKEGEEITEKAIVPEVCSSETECAPGIIPSVPKSDQLPESSSVKSEESTEISEGTTESNKIPEAEVHTEETNEIPESGTEGVARVTEKSGETTQPEESSGEKPTEVPVKEEEGSGEAPEEGSGATESFPEATAEPETIHKTKEPEIPEGQEATTVGQKPEHPVETEAPLPHVPHQISTETEQPSVSSTEQEPESIPTESNSKYPYTTEHPEQTELPEREIPGEGSCLVDGQTYKNNSSVPPINHCQTSCKCVSSILRCESIECTPPPVGLQNCMPLFDGPNSCCPIYSCTGPETTSPMESDSYVVHSTPKTIGMPEITEAPLEVTTSQVIEGEISEKVPETASVEVTSPEESITQVPHEVTEGPSDSEVTPKLIEVVTEETAGGQPEEEPIIHTTQKEVEEETESQTVQQLEGISQQAAGPEVVTATSKLPEETETDEISHLPEDSFVSTSEPIVTSKPAEEGTSVPEVGTMKSEAGATEMPGSEEQPEIIKKGVSEEVTGLPQQPVTEQQTEKIPEPITSQEHVTSVTTLTPELVSKETESETEVNVTPEMEHEHEEATQSLQPGSVTEGEQLLNGTEQPHITEHITEPEKHLPKTTVIPDLPKEGTEIPTIPEEEPKENEVPATEKPVEEATEIIIKEGKPHIPAEVPEKSEEVPEEENTTESQEPIKHDIEPEENMATAKPIESELQITTQVPFKAQTIIPDEQATEKEPSISTLESEISQEPGAYVTESVKTSATNKPFEPELHVTSQKPFEVDTKVPERQTTEELFGKQPIDGTGEEEHATATSPESEEPVEHITVPAEEMGTSKPIESDSHGITQGPSEVETKVPVEQTTPEVTYEKEPTKQTEEEQHTIAPQESEETNEHVTVSEKEKGTERPSELEPHPVEQEPSELGTNEPVEQTTEELTVSEITPKRQPSETTEDQQTTVASVEDEKPFEQEMGTIMPVESESHVSPQEPSDVVTKVPAQDTTEEIVVPEVVSESQPSEEAEEHHTTVKSQESEESVEHVTVSEEEMGTTKPIESGSHVSLPSDVEIEIPVVQTTEAMLFPEVASQKQPSEEVAEQHTAATPQETEEPFNIPEEDIGTAKPEEPSGVVIKTSEKETTENIPVTEESIVSQQSEEEQHVPEHVTVLEGESSTVKAIESESHVTEEPIIVETKLPGEQTTEQIIVPKETTKYPSQEDKLITEQPQLEITKKPSEYETVTEGQVEATQPPEVATDITPSSEEDREALGTERSPSKPAVTEEHETQTSDEIAHVPSEVITSPASVEEEPTAMTEKSEKAEIETEGISPVTEKLDEVPSETSGTEKTPEEPVTIRTTGISEEPSAEDNEIPASQTEKENAGQPAVSHEVQSEIEKTSESTQQPETPYKEVSEKETDKPSISEEGQTTLPAGEIEPQTEQPEEDKTKLHEATPEEEPITEYLPEVQTIQPQPQDITEPLPELQTAEPHPQPETTASGESEEPRLPEQTTGPTEPEKEVTISGESATSVPTASEQITPGKEGASVPEHPSGEEEKVYGSSETEKPSISEEESKPTIPSETELPSEKDKIEPVSEENKTEPTVGTVKPSTSEGEAVTSQTEKPSISDGGKIYLTEAPVVEQTEEQVNTSEVGIPASTKRPVPPPGESSNIGEPSEVPAFTSPEITTPIAEERDNGTIPVEEGLFTSGPAVEAITKKYIPGQLSTSAPVSEPTTILPATTSTEQPPSHVPGEQVPESGDYDQHGVEYDEEDQNAFGPGTCRYGGKVYVSAQQIPRDDPCDFCFCFRSDIICLQQSCPPPIPRCHEEPIRGFCCPRYECPVSMATAVNVTTSTTTTTTTLPPHFLSHAYKGRATKTGCQISGKAYKVGDVIRATSGPCLHCTCGGDGQMKCDPKPCSPEPMLRQMIAAATLRRR